MGKFRANRFSGVRRGVEGAVTGERIRSLTQGDLWGLSAARLLQRGRIP